MELKFKVNEIKNELEDYLTKLKNILFSCENLHKSIENYESGNNNMKTLYFISIIHNNNEKTCNFLKTKIKNLNIAMDNDSFVNYENYYFNGIPMPKDIKVEKIGEQLNINWDIDDSIIKDIESKDIKFFILIKGNIFDWKEETINKYINFDRCYENNNYEIKVRTLMDGCYSDWSQIKKFKYERKKD